MEESMKIVNNVPRVSNDELNRFSETEEQRKRRRQIQREIRRKRGLRTNIKNSPKKEAKKHKYKESKGKNLKKIFAILGVGAIAIAGTTAIISNIENEKKEYDKVASTVQGLNEEQIVEEAEKELKEEIGEATGEELEDISISARWTDSSTYVTRTRAGEDVFEYVEDGRGINEGTESKNISNLISEIKSTNGSREKAITSLKNVRKFNKKYKITVKDGKLIEKDRDEER